MTKKKSTKKSPGKREIAAAVAAFEEIVAHLNQPKYARVVTTVLELLDEAIYLREELDAAREELDAARLEIDDLNDQVSSLEAELRELS